jgi:hypothetical protein
MRPVIRPSANPGLGQVLSGALRPKNLGSSAAQGQPRRGSDGRAP